MKSDKMAPAALRVLEQYGLARPLVRGSPEARLRLVATPARIRAELAGRDPELALLRVVWSRGGGDAAYRGAVIPWRHLASVAGNRQDAERLLVGLEQEGFLELLPGGVEGVWVLDRATPRGRLPIDWMALEEKRRRDERKLQRMQQYAYTEECRRGFVLRYFGDPAAMRSCGACDNCLRPAGENRSAPDGTGRRALEKELRQLRKALSGRTRVPEFGVFSEEVLTALAEAAPRTVEEVMRVPGVTRTLLDRWGTPLMGVLTGQSSLPSGRPAKRQRRPPAAEAAEAPRPTREQSELYARLKALRANLARDAGLPAYCVFGDRTLVEMARRRPLSEAELLAVPGVGPAKLERYGKAFLDLLAA